jgi:hypothetical protein
MIQQAWYQAWNVYFAVAKIDTVYFQPSMNAEEVKKVLVDHDGYHANIRVRKG